MNLFKNKEPWYIMYKKVGYIFSNGFSYVPCIVYPLFPKTNTLGTLHETLLNEIGSNIRLLKVETDYRIILYTYISHHNYLLGKGGYVFGSVG